MKPEYFNGLNYQLELTDMNLQFMRSKLAAIPIEKRGELRTKLVPWIFTNDVGFGSALSQISKGMERQKKGGKPRAAVISGVGALLTVAPYLDLDAVVSIDRNSFVLDQVQKMVQTIHEAETREEYKELAQLEEFFGLMQLEDVDPEPYYEIEKQSFGKKHFLASDNSYQKSRQALQKTPVFFSQGNFTHKPYIDELGNAMRDTEVVYANFTDLGEWYPQFFQAIAEFPLAEDSVISWSTNNKNEGRPQAMVSIGLEDYLQNAQNAQNAMQGIDISYFKAHV